MFKQKLKLVFLITFILFSTKSFSQTNADKLLQYVAQKDVLEAIKLIPVASAEKPKDQNFQVTCGDLYFENDQLDSALKYYKIADKINSDKPFVMRKIARVLYTQEKYPESEKILNSAIKEDKNDIETYLEFAEFYIKENKMNEAEIQIQRAQKIDPKNIKTFMTLGNMFFAQGIYELSKGNFEEALKIDENNIEARVKLATSYYWMANREPDSLLANELFGLSLKEWNTVTKKDPKNAKAFYEQGKILFWSKRYTDASKVLYQYFLLRPEGALGRWWLGQSLYEIQRCDSAAIHLDYAANTIDTVKNKAKLMLARCYYDNKNYPKCVESYIRTIKDTTLDFVDFRKFGTATLFSGDTVKAVAIYKEIVQKFPENSCKINDLVGRLLVSSKKYNDALYFLNNRLGNKSCSDSNDAKTYFYVGISYLNISNQDSSKKEENAIMVDSARVNLIKALELDSNQLTALLNLGSVYEFQKKTEDAESTYLKVVTLASKDTLGNKGIINNAFAKLCGPKYNKKQFKDLIKLGKMWSEILPNVAFGYIYTAVGYQGSNDKDNACKYYRKALAIDPNNQTAQKSIKQICE